MFLDGCYRADLGPFYYTYDARALAFGIWFFADTDNTLSMEIVFLSFCIGVSIPLWKSQEN